MPCGPLAVHGVEPERQPEQRRDEAEEPGDARQRDRSPTSGVNQNSAMKIAWPPLTLDADGADHVGGEVERDRRDQPEQEHQDEEAGRQEVVGELLARDDHPAGPGTDRSQRGTAVSRSSSSVAAGVWRVTGLAGRVVASCDWSGGRRRARDRASRSRGSARRAASVRDAAARCGRATRRRAATARR